MRNMWIRIVPLTKTNVGHNQSHKQHVNCDGDSNEKQDNNKRVVTRPTILVFTVVMDMAPILMIAIVISP